MLNATLINRHGDPLYCTVHPATESSSRRVLVLCHGFKGFKDWGFFPYAATRFAQAGWQVVRFNFSLNGVGAGTDFNDPDAFGRNTLTREVEDLDDMLSAVMAGLVPAIPDHPTRIAVLGHSRGGGIAILRASRDPRIHTLVTWASVCTFARYGEETIRIWKEQGRIEIRNARTGQIMPLYLSLLEDYEQNENALNVLKAAATISIPWLIVHGDQDQSVPVEEAEHLLEAAPRIGTRLLRIPHTDHVFGASHPLPSPVPTALEKVISESIAWLDLTGGDQTS